MRRLLLMFAALIWMSDDVMAQAETLPRNHWVFSVFYTRSDTEKRFDFLGERVRVVPPGGPLFTGFTRTDVVSFDVAYGITDRLEAHVTIPYASSEIATVGVQGRKHPDATLSPAASGISNVRFGVRYNFYRNDRTFVTARFDVKTPANSTDLQKAFAGTTLPVDEGQTDFDLTGQVSRTFTLKGRGLRLGGEAGVRIRLEQQNGALDFFTGETLPVKPANEFIYNFQASYQLHQRISLIISGNGIEQGDYDVPFRTIRVGEDGEVKTVGTRGQVPSGFRPDFEKQTGRRIFSLGPIVNLSVKPRTIVTGGVLFTVSGRNYPAGQFWVLGLSRFF